MVYVSEHLLSYALHIGEEILGEPLTEEEIDLIEEELYMQMDYYESECPGMGHHYEEWIMNSMEEIVENCLETKGRE